MRRIRCVCSRFGLLPKHVCAASGAKPTQSTKPVLLCGRVHLSVWLSHCCGQVQNVKDEEDCHVGAFPIVFESVCVPMSFAEGGFPRTQGVLVWYCINTCLLLSMKTIFRKWALLASVCDAVHCDVERAECLPLWRRAERRAGLLYALHVHEIFLPLIYSPSELLTSSKICSRNLAVVPFAALLNVPVRHRMSVRFNIPSISPSVSTKTCCLNVFFHVRHELTATTMMCLFFLPQPVRVLGSLMSTSSDALAFPSSWNASAVSVPSS